MDRVTGYLLDRLRCRGYRHSLHIDAVGTNASLSRSAELARQGSLNGQVNVRIFKYHKGGVASKLEAELFE